MQQGNCKSFPSSINCQFWHHSCIWFKEPPPNFVAHTYLIFRNQKDIQHFLYFPNFHLPLGNFIWTHIVSRVQLMFTHAGHVILQLILYKLCSKAMQKLSNSINCQFWHHSCIWFKEPPPNLVSHPYLIFRDMWHIQHCQFFSNFHLPLGNFR